MEGGLPVRPPGGLRRAHRRGRERLEEAAPDHVAAVRRHLIDRLDDEELVHLADALERVRTTCDEPTP